MTALVSLVLIAVAIFAVAKQVEVRLVLFLTAMAIGSLAGQPEAVIQAFLVTFASGQFIVPICTAMGFAYVLKNTGCDAHLIHLLTGPLQRIRPLLVPGTVLVGFLVNIPIISQTSTALAVGTVLVPLLRAAGVSAVTTGAALLLGASVGGELLNPAAPELLTVSTVLTTVHKIEVAPTDCVRHIAPLLAVQLSVATGLFWLLSWRADRQRTDVTPSPAPPTTDETPFRVNIVKALVPIVPLGLLMLTGPPLNLLEVPKAWLVNVDNAADVKAFNTRLIGAAMLLGVACASLTERKKFGSTFTAFFAGAGYAYTHIISLIVVATCFGKAIDVSGLAAHLQGFVGHNALLLVASAALLPLGFAALSGSGMASTQSLYGFFAEPALKLGMDPVHIGAVVSISAAAGRTMSAVAAVTLMCATLTETSPFALVRRVAPPLLAGIVAVVATSALMFTFR